MLCISSIFIDSSDQTLSPFNIRGSRHLQRDVLSLRIVVVAFDAYWRCSTGAEEVVNWSTQLIDYLVQIIATSRDEA